MRLNLRHSMIFASKGCKVITEVNTLVAPLRSISPMQSLTVHNTLEYNGVSKRLNQTLLEKVQAMLHASELLKFLWGKAVKHVVYLKN